MQAWVCHHLSPDRSGLRFETDWPEPAEPGPGQVRVAMAAAALNYPDLLMLSGDYQYRPEVPFIPGVEGCGVIDEVGEGLAGELIGERVIVGARSGLLAERVTVDAAQVRPVPHDLHDDEAAAHTVGSLTAYVALVQRGRLQRGDRLLVLGAGGGMGLAAVAVGKAIGAEVIAAAASPEKLAAAETAGATELILCDRAAPYFGAIKGRVDIVFDPLGGPYLVPALRSLAWGGRYLVVGFVAGQPPAIQPNHLLIKGTELIGVRAGEQGRQHPASGIAAREAIDRLADAGMKPHIGLRVSLHEADRLFAAMADGSLIGKAMALIG